jgi:type IV pilus assembly protein PilF
MWRNTLICCLLVVSLSACETLEQKEHDDAADVHLQLGVRYLNLGNLPAAKENLEQAIEKDSDSVPAHLALAFLYERLTKFDDARVHYETAYKLDPENLNLQNNYGRFLCDRREFDKGMALLDKLSTNLLDTTPWMTDTNLGRCKLAMGDKATAEKYLGKALQQNPTYAPALLEMQKISYQNNNYNAAKDYLQRYLNVADQSPETLWIAIQTEAALGNSALVKEYTDLLLEKYPFSNEAKQIKSTSRPR